MWTPSIACTSSREEAVSFDTTLKQFAQRRIACPTGVPCIDDAWHGGASPGAVLELVGGTGSGKSLLAYTVVARVLVDSSAVARSAPPDCLARHVAFVDCDGRFCLRLFACVLLRTVRALPHGGELPVAQLDAVLVDCFTRLHVYVASGSTAAVQQVCESVATGKPPEPLPPGRRRRLEAAATSELARWGGGDEARAVVIGQRSAASVMPLAPTSAAACAIGLSFALIVVDSLGAHVWSDRAFRSRAQSDTLQATTASLLHAAAASHACALIVTRPLVYGGGSESVAGVCWPGCAEVAAGIEAASKKAAVGGVSTRRNEAFLPETTAALAVATSLPSWSGTAAATGGAAAPSLRQTGGGGPRPIDAPALARLLTPYSYPGLVGGGWGGRQHASSATVTVLLARVHPSLQPVKRLAEGRACISSSSAGGLSPVPTLVLARRLPPPAASGVGWAMPPSGTLAFAESLVALSA